FDDDTEVHRDRVWWTAVGITAAFTTLIAAPAFALRGSLARLALGAEVANGGYLFALATCSLWVGSMDMTLEQYLRAVKVSKLIVGISIGRLLLNVALNVTFLAGFGLGLAGVLWGNLAAGCASLAVRFLVFVHSRGMPAFVPRLAGEFWRFGWPLIVTGLLSALMHEADRYYLRAFADLHQLGLYSLAYQIGQGVNTLVLLPFSAIWGVLMFEIAREPKAK